MEKVTNYAAWHSLKTYGGVKKIKFEFSERGGVRYDELSSYFKVLQQNDEQGTQTAAYDTINWSTVDHDLIRVFPHTRRAGLIMPDIVASSFYMACDKHERGLPCDPKPAVRLMPRMALRNDNRSSSCAGFGVKLMPSGRRADLDGDQTVIFRRYGYQF